jgi:hypothetical protein
MTAFILRGRTVPSLADLTAIEQIWIADRTPALPVTGVGYGTLLEISEREDGPFDTPTEVFGDNDELTTFGGLGYTYGELIHQNPCARTHLTELWNGNGYMKTRGMRPNRKIICRVDTSVGNVTFSLAASLRSARQTFALAAADQLSLTTDVGGPVNCTAVTATAATAAGAGFAPGPTGFAGGERCSIQIDALPAVTITFQAADQSAAQVVARINTIFGTTIAVVNAGEIDISSIQLGSGANVTLADIDAGTLAAIGHAAGASAGAGNVANSAAVTSAEVAALINIAGIIAINGVAVADTITGELIVYRNGSTTGTIQIDDVAGAMATDMGFTTATVVTANVGAAFDLAAGTRVRNAGADEWVTMRTLSWPEGTVAAPNTGTQIVEVRPGLDNGTLAGSIAGTVTTLVDYPTTRFVEVNNAANLAAALTEAQIDAAYEAAFDATLSPELVSRAVTCSLSARLSAAVMRRGRQNANDASDDRGNQGRIFVGRAPLGFTSAQAITDVALYRADRVVYTWPGWQQTFTEIAAVGATGGVGFNDTGVLTVGADAAAADLMCRLNPEENIGQNTPFLTYLTGMEATGVDMNIALYTALRAAGICAPRIDNDGNFVYQSEVLSTLESGRTTIKRRKMSDFIQDSLARALIPYTKQLATDARVAGVDATLDSFLSGLLSVNTPDNQRIGAYSVENVTSENPDLEALEIFYWKVQVQILASMDTMVLDALVGYQELAVSAA